MREDDVLLWHICDAGAGMQMRFKEFIPCLRISADEIDKVRSYMKTRHPTVRYDLDVFDAPTPATPTGDGKAVEPTS